MKGQKGSALLTVILIIAVTVTIGAALSSMIMYNYKLRSYDIAIQRAEYAAISIMDNIVFLAKQEINEKVEYEWLDDIEYTIKDDAENAKIYYDVLESEDEKYEYIISDDNIYLTLAGEIFESVNDKTHDNYNKMLQEKFFSWLSDWCKDWTKILKDDLGYNLVDSVTEFNEDETPDICLNFQNDEDDEILVERTNETLIVPVKIFYNTKSSPIVQISLNFKILIPSYASADNGSLYSFLDNIVGFSDIKYKDWGYI